MRGSLRAWPCGIPMVVCRCALRVCAPKKLPKSANRSSGDLLQATVARGQTSRSVVLPVIPRLFAPPERHAGRYGHSQKTCGRGAGEAGSPRLQGIASQAQSCVSRGVASIRQTPRCRRMCPLSRALMSTHACLASLLRTSWQADGAACEKNDRPERPKRALRARKRWA